MTYCTFSYIFMQRHWLKIYCFTHIWRRMLFLAQHYFFLATPKRKGIRNPKAQKQNWYLSKFYQKGSNDPKDFDVNPILYTPLFKSPILPVESGGFIPYFRSIFSVFHRIRNFRPVVTSGWIKFAVAIGLPWEYRARNIGISSH